MNGRRASECEAVVWLDHIASMCCMVAAKMALAILHTSPLRLQCELREPERMAERTKPLTFSATTQKGKCYSPHNHSSSMEHTERG